MVWWQILVGIILFIVALGVLIGIHELGHLGAAKMFHVYCFNYSIGFGPKLISSKRSKKHETVWTLRAIPLGGFVSMYGEGVELDDDEYVPPSRSLEGIARYKRAIIISAGVALNFALGFVLIFLHNACFDQVRFYFYQVGMTEHRTTMPCNFSKTFKESYPVQNGDFLDANMDPFKDVFIIDQNIEIKDSSYFLCMKNTVNTTVKDPLISDGLVLYSTTTRENIIDAAIKYDQNNDAKYRFDLTYNRLVNMTVINNGISKDDQASIDEIKNNIETIYNSGKEQYKEEYFKQTKIYYETIGIIDDRVPYEVYGIDSSLPDSINADIVIRNKDNVTTTHNVEIKLNKSSKTFKNCGIYLKRFFYHYNAGEVFKVTWNEWCGANTAVFRGIGALFTGQGELSGPIGIARMSTTVLANFGFERYLSLWGMISCNLAILNLIPFPGLDGWALVVIGYEAITKKQIPTKVKGIISVIGLGLLLLLMIFIIIKDVMGLII